MNIKSILDLFFPFHCVRCERTTDREPFCEHCFRAIPLHVTLFCGTCHARVPRDEKICHFSLPFILGAATDFHTPGIQELIHALKFENVRAAALPLSRLMAEYVHTAIPELENIVLVPVPLSKKRFRVRGYNQSEILASQLSRLLAIPMETGALERTQHADPQSSLRDFARRRDNVAGHFQVAHPEVVSEKNIFLVDDVSTSGSTFFECARALKAAGAGKIIALAAAKA